MRLTAVSTAPGGSTQTLIGGRQIVNPAPGVPRRFHLPLFLRFVTGGADGIAISAAKTTLQGAFQPLDYDALHPPQPALKASLANLGGAVAVTLDAPRHVRSIRVTANVPASAKTIDWCRLDGNAITEKPTVSATLNGKVATIPANVDFRDARFALRLRDPGGATIDLDLAHIAEVNVRAYPATPRVGIASAQTPEQPIAFMTLPGEIGTTVNDGAFDASATLATALAAHVDDLRAATPGAPLTDPLDVALVIASDAPCRLDTTAFAIEARLVQESFSPRAEKVALRFNGGQEQLRSVTIALPSGATVRSASVRAIESFGCDRGPLLNDDVSATGLLHTSTGVAIDSTRWTIQQIAPSEAITTTGIALALLPLLEQTSLLVEIQEDWHGRPSGKQVAGGTIALDRLGTPGWVALQLPDPITLPTRPHWLMLRAASGHAVWLTQPGSAPLGLLDGSSLFPLAGLEARYGFIVLSSIAEQSPLTHPTTLSIGDAPIVAIPDTKGAMHYDLTAALNAALEEAADETLPIIPITVTSSLPGFLTLYPPRVEYDL